MDERDNAPRRARAKPREGWDESFRAMAEAGDDKLLLPDDLPNEFDDTKWQW
jgi:antitoxin MazE